MGSSSPEFLSAQPDYQSLELERIPKLTLQLSACKDVLYHWAMAPPLVESTFVIQKTFKQPYMLGKTFLSHTVLELESGTKGKQSQAPSIQCVI